MLGLHPSPVHSVLPSGINVLPAARKGPLPDLASIMLVNYTFGNHAALRIQNWICRQLSAAYFGGADAMPVYYYDCFTGPDARPRINRQTCLI